MSQSPMSQSPMTLPPTPAESIDWLEAQLSTLRYHAGRVMDTPVIGPRGQQLTVTQAQQRAQQIGDAIDSQEAQGSQRHRRVSRLATALALSVVVIIDFPIMLWLAASVFNVYWADPLGLPLAISVVVSILTTGGAAAALYHLGHDQRQNKNYRRQLDTAALTLGSKISLAAVAVLILLIALVAFYRIWTEGVLSGLDRLALLLALLVAVVMLISAWLVFWVAFRDGSPEQDDLSHYTRLVSHHLILRRSHEDEATQLEHQIELLRRCVYRTSNRILLNPPDIALDPPDIAHNAQAPTPAPRWTELIQADPTAIENGAVVTGRDKDQSGAPG